MLRLSVVIASTRPGRVGLPVGTWFAEAARAHGGFDVTLEDLAERALPVFDEPKHPRLRQYEHDHTRRWSEAVEAADAFVFVAPEYNHGPTPALVNALTYLVQEWARKPAAFVTYGGVSGGVRGAQSMKAILTTFKIMPLPESVTIPFVQQHLAEGAFKPNEQHEAAVAPMLDELRLWAEALKPLRG